MVSSKNVKLFLTENNILKMSQHEKQSIHVESSIFLSLQVTLEGFTSKERSKKEFRLNLLPHFYNLAHTESLAYHDLTV